MQSPSSDANSMMQLLQRDFLYNLSLLRERDAELERYDLEVVVLREELETSEAANGVLRRLLAEDAALKAEMEGMEASLARARRLTDKAQMKVENLKE